MKTCSYLLALSLVTSCCLAADYCVTVGGGYSRSGNQVSIERNVAFQQSVLASLTGGPPSLDVFFSDGAGQGADVVYRDPAATEAHPSALYLYARIFSDDDSYAIRYRNHQLTGIAGPSHPKLLELRLRTLARKVGPGDRLLFYATAHGGKAEQEPGRRGRRRRRGAESEEQAQEPPFNEFNTTLYFWDRKTVAASEFEAMLDRLPPDVPVILVMVQCYSGGFSHVIFDEANAQKGLSPHLRCGFFSQVHDRPAAGCTPDVEEADYQEYSSFFWAALGGVTRAGEPVTDADYDGNGRVSFAEAHAYAVLQSDTIDIPIRTTGAFLRAIDRPQGHPEPRFEGKLSELSRTARSDQWAILLGLPGKIGLGVDATMQDVRNAQWRLRREQRNAQRELSRAARDTLEARRNLRERVKEMWPDIEDGRNRYTRELVSDHADEFIEQVESLPEYEAYLCAEDIRQQKDRLADHLRCQEIKALRLLRTCQNILLADDLPNVASLEVLKRYEQMRDLEEGYLVNSPGEDVLGARR
ncbi:MAG: hypothetical protein KDA37_02530 [Planctomycetales bacterium]|nr:hypothetical protein [Planctomycetales bacterium]